MPVQQNTTKRLPDDHWEFVEFYVTNDDHSVISIWFVCHSVLIHLLDGYFYLQVAGGFAAVMT